MFSFFKKKRFAHQDYAHLVADMHSHLIPGIDDGAKNMEDAIQLIRHLQDLGYQKIFTTPHIMSEYYPNNPEILRNGFSILKKGMEEVGMSIEIEVGSATPIA